MKSDAKTTVDAAPESIAGDPPVVSIVVPCYGEEAALALNIPVLTACLEGYIREGIADPASEIVFVDDGSPDGTWNVVKSAHAASPLVRGVRFSANRGQQNALYAGFEAAKGDFIITIDADLQDDVSAMRDMILEARRGVDVVYGIRKARPNDTFLKRATAGMFYRLAALLGVNLMYNHSEFRGMSRRTIDAILEYRERNLFLRGLVQQLGFKTSTVYYDRQKRTAGETKYSPIKLLYAAIYGIASFTFVPLRLVTLLGLALCGFSVLLVIWVLWEKFIAQSTVSGWASMLLILSIFGGMQLFCLGVIGEYLAIIFMEVKDRPRYHIAETTDDERPAGGASTLGSQPGKNR